MARIRTIKPELAAHEGLFDLERETQLPIRFAWCMLFTVADREGRFAWRPRTLKAQILPHDEIDFARVLDAWVTRGFVVKYRVKGEWFGWIPTFTKHQVINNRESPSDLPAIDECEEVNDFRDQPLANASSTGEARVNDASATREVHAQAEGKGREGKGNKKEPPIPPAAKRTPKEPFDPAKVSGLDIGAWNAWVQYRAERKPAIKPASMQAAAEELAAFGQQQATVVRHSKANGYQGLFAPKVNGNAPAGLSPVLTHEQRELAELQKLVDRRRPIGLDDFREPHPGESAQAYRNAQDAEWHERKTKKHRPELWMAAGALKAVTS